METKQYDVIIIGGGLTGLSAAAYLQKQGLSLKVIEKEERIGGQIQSFQSFGFTYEAGPNSGIISREEVYDLMKLLPKSEKLFQLANQESKKRFILKEGRFHEMPSGAKSAFTTSLFSWYDKFRILGEPFRAKGTDPNESLKDLVIRRLGRSYYDYAVDPFIGGIYAGDPSKLTTRFALPKLYDLEAKHGSFIRGAFAKMKEKPKEGYPKPSKEIFSAHGGLSELIKSLADTLKPNSISLGADIQTIRQQENKSWLLRVQEKDNIYDYESRYLISTVPAYQLKNLFPFLGGKFYQAINKLVYAPVIQLALGYNYAPDINFHGFGGLMPSCEEKDLLGILNLSASFTGRTPKGGLLLSAFMGGLRNPELLNKTDEELLQILFNRLERFLGLKQSPDLCKIFRYPKAIPQYGAYMEDIYSVIEEVEKHYKGLILAGNIRDGIGIPDRIKQAIEIAKKLSD